MTNQKIIVETYFDELYNVKDGLFEIESKINDVERDAYQLNATLNRIGGTDSFNSNELVDAVYNKVLGRELQELQDELLKHTDEFIKHIDESKILDTGVYSVWLELLKGFATLKTEFDTINEVKAHINKVRNDIYKVINLTPMANVPIWMQEVE